ncbi:MAG: M56 family metallopeptidase [Planctomycetaceae bacterium]|nr:M56 family metallopeptidase [Planctomycetaceae bacterium]
MQTFLDAPATAVILEKLGWVLVHSLWQFAAVAAVTSAATAVAWRAGPRLRHGLFVCGLVAMAALPVVTWHTLDVRPQPQAADATGSGAAAGVLARGAWVPPPDGAARTAAAATPWTAASGGDAIAEGIRPWLGLLTAAWLVGVATAAVRPLVGWLAWRRLTTTGAAEVPAAVMRMVERARRRLGIGQAVRVVQSAAVRVPAVAGWLRPVMLVPLALVTSLAPRELETLIVHELAHVRRGDLLVHILQLLLETIAFYHPAVWWLSARIRVEREHCCDDLVVATTGDCAAYGRALVAVAELRGRELVPVLGAADGSIVARIRRLVTGVDPAVGGWPLPAFAMAGLVGLVLTLGLAATTAADGPADDRRLLEDPDSLRSLTPAQAELLREFMPLENEVAIARGIPAMSLPLRGLKTLDAETARVLSAGFKKAHVGVLLLDGLTTLDADTAQALATPRGSFPAQVSLGGLTTIDAATAAQLVTIQGLWLNGLTSLTPGNTLPGSRRGARGRAPACSEPRRPDHASARRRQGIREHQDFQAESQRLEVARAGSGRVAPEFESDQGPESQRPDQAHAGRRPGARGRHDGASRRAHRNRRRPRPSDRRGQAAVRAHERAGDTHPGNHAGVARVPGPGAPDPCQDARRLRGS